MATRVDIEEIAPTRSERFLAVVLTAFLLVGSIWLYVNTDDWARDISPDPPRSAGEKAAIQDQEAAANREADAELALEQATTDLEIAREDYRTALEAGEPTDRLEAGYREAQENREKADAEAESARAAVQAADAKAQRAWRSYEQRIEDATSNRALAVAGVRLLVAAGWIVASFRLIGELRRRESRYLPLGFAMAATGVITALVFAADYVTDYIDPLDLGPLVLSVIGVAATVVAYTVLQRHLARRIPVRRIRKGECPFCGFPLRGDREHCEGCGREVIAECATCGLPRRVGSAHCAACGKK